MKDIKETKKWRVAGETQAATKEGSNSFYEKHKEAFH